MGSIITEIRPGNEYKLGRGGPEAVRLTAQHHTLIGRQGFLLHPTIAAAVQGISRPRIADVATGTGIWAIDIARVMPHAEVIGLDISDAQFPPKWTVPSNVSFGIHDLLQDVPSELRGTFDVVHVRLLLAAGPAVDKKVFVDQFRTLLKPGGWLQWDELSFPNMVACFPTETGVETIALDDYPPVEAMSKFVGLKDRTNWIHDFESEVTDADGFACVQKTVAPLRPYLMKAETDLNNVVVTDLLNRFIKNKGVEGTAIECEIRDALTKFHTDIDNGVLFAYCWNSCIARAL